MVLAQNRRKVTKQDPLDRGVEFGKTRTSGSSRLPASLTCRRGRRSARNATTTVGESGSDPHSTEALHSCLAALVHTSGAPRGPRGSMGTRIRSVEGGVGG